MTPSLNVAMIANLPGIELAEHIRGKRGGDSLGTAIGIGFVPNNQTVDLAPDFHLR